MRKGKILKLIKSIAITILGLILVIIIGLIANNRLWALKCSKLDTNGEVLTSGEISAVKGAYEYLDNYGDDIFKGLKDNKDLIIFNDSYEFLFSDHEVASGWNFICHNAELNKKIYSKKANNPQAFAVFVDDEWIGSMGTKETFNKSIVNSVPVFFPPQIMMIDDEYYKAIIIHEMVHAYQANNNKARFVSIQTLHDICGKYRDDKSYNEKILQEASYLEQSIISTKYEDVLEFSRKFLEIREKRRAECNMNLVEIQSEVDFEWLEGLARYAEYKASSDSNSLLAKNLLDIDQKVKAQGDERYYALGMAQAIVLDRLQKNWKNDIFTNNFSMEEYIKEICLSN